MEELVEPLIMEQLKTQSVVTSVVFASFSLGTVAPQIDSIFVQVRSSNTLVSGPGFLVTEQIVASFWTGSTKDQSVDTFSS